MDIGEGIAIAGQGLAQGITKRAETKKEIQKKQQAVSALQSFFDSAKLTPEQESQFNPVKSTMLAEAASSGDISTALKVGSALLEFSQSNQSGFGKKELDKMKLDVYTKTGNLEALKATTPEELSPLLQQQAVAPINLAIAKEVAVGETRTARALEKNALQQLDTMQSVKGDINDLLTSFTQVPGGWRGPIAGTAAPIRARFFPQAEVLNYDESVKSFASTLSRFLGGEKGALNEGDIKRAVSMVPKLWMDNKTAALRMEQLARFLKRRIDVYN